MLSIIMIVMGEGKELYALNHYDCNGGGLEVIWSQS